MKLDGRAIAAEIIESLQKRTAKLISRKTIPHLLIIMTLDDPQTEAYIRQKLLRAKQIGAKVTLKRTSQKISQEKLLEIIDSANRDRKIQGIIIQRPMPKQIDEMAVAETVIVEKDVDGFNPKSKFTAPVALAVLKFVETARGEEISEFLKTRKIAVIGKGTTAGRPTINLLNRLGFSFHIIDSKTPDAEREKILKSSDIIISCVGKKILSKDDIKSNAFLIGVGMHVEDDKLHGDYDEDDIKDKVSFYTPTPGGVGPVNVSMLMKNLVEAAENLSK
jgi:methylenetetrahydrofolate dehydrogenase (NADP+)/methenyltetrahydrofolate cyclohydrolase